jgi:hypothetical protein
MKTGMPLALSNRLVPWSSGPCCSPLAVRTNIANPAPTRKLGTNAPQAPRRAIRSTVATFIDTTHEIQLDVHEIE